MRRPPAANVIERSGGTQRRFFVPALMRNIYWGLGSKQYDTYDDFVAAVTEYNTAIHPEKNQWQPDRVVAEAPIRVLYEAMWRDENDLLDLVIGEPGVPL